VKAAGLTPEQLRQQVEKAAAEFVEEPSVTVVVKQINSRRVFVTGNVLKAGVYPLTTSMTVLQAIAAAGGLNEYADEKGIAVMRVEGGQTTRFKFNYKDVRRGKKLEQNIVLRPGDTIVVP
jgi:polysaccharide export outer membrane protein